MEERQNIKKRILRICASILTLVLLFLLLPIRGESGIYDAVIRFHVLANSNSDIDQQMKLYVRDRVLSECASELVSEEKNASEAVRTLSADMSVVEACAEKAVSDFCAEKSIDIVPAVTCTIGREHYPYKKYESLCFPEGEYYSLKITIGEGEGENWWCVLFPPLCFGAVSKEIEKEPSEEDFISVGITGEQYKIISESEKPKYRLRFRLLEVIESFFD